MPRIPVPERSGRSRIAIQATAPRAAPGQFGKLGGTLAELGDALLHIEESVRKVNNLHQVTKATNDANEQIMAVQDAALTDPDLNDNLPKYQQRIQQIADASARLVDDPLEKMSFTNTLKTRLTSIDFELVKEARKTLGRKTLSELGRAEELTYESAYRAPNEIVLQERLAEYRQQALNSVGPGMMTLEQAQEQVAKVSNNARQINAKRRIVHDAKDGLLFMRSGQHGITNPTVVAELTAEAEKAVIAQEKNGEKSLSDLHRTNEISAIKGLLDDQLTLERLEMLEARQAIPGDVAELLKENILSPNSKTVEDGDPQVYNNLFLEATRTIEFRKAQVEGKTKRISQEFRPTDNARVLMRRVIQANSNGQITRGQMRDLVGLIDVDFQNSENQARIFQWGKVARVLSHFTTNGILRTRTGNLLATDLVKRIQKGEIKPNEVDKVLKETVTSAIKSEHPETILQDELPDGVASATGATAPLTPANVPEVAMQHHSGRRFSIPQSRVQAAQKAGLRIVTETENGKANE